MFATHYSQQQLSSGLVSASQGSISLQSRLAGAGTPSSCVGVDFVRMRRRRSLTVGGERRRGPAWAGHPKMAEKQNQFSPSVPPLIPPPVSSSSSVPPSSSASGVGFSSQSFQDQPLYSSVLPKSQRKDHTHRPPSMTTPTTGVPSPSTNQDTSSKAAVTSKGR